MNFLLRIKEFFTRIKNKQLQIVEPKGNIEPEETIEIPDGFIAPKGTVQDEKLESLAQKLHVSTEDFGNNTVTFEELNRNWARMLAENTMRKFVGGNIGWTHEKEPTVTGKLKGEDFVSLARRGKKAQTICLKNGYYDIEEFGSDISYKEILNLADGTNVRFYFQTGRERKNPSVISMMSKGGITIVERADYIIMHGEGMEFENFAQPSDELLKEYSDATGLPIIMDSYKISEIKARTGLHNMEPLDFFMRNQGLSSSFPYSVSIEISKKTDAEKTKKKAIKYLYHTPKEYIDGEKPYMIYMEGIDGRTGYSGMFRLKGDSYIDNSTFRKENGEYKYDTVSLEQIMELAGKMPTQLSPRVMAIARSEMGMPAAIKMIYDKAISRENRMNNNTDQVVK